MAVALNPTERRSAPAIHRQISVFIHCWRWQYLPARLGRGISRSIPAAVGKSEVLQRVFLLSSFCRFLTPSINKHILFAFAAGVAASFAPTPPWGQEGSSDFLITAGAQQECFMSKIGHHIRLYPVTAFGRLTLVASRRKRTTFSGSNGRSSFGDDTLTGKENPSVCSRWPNLALGRVIDVSREVSRSNPLYFAAISCHQQDRRIADFGARHQQAIREIKGRLHR